MTAPALTGEPRIAEAVFLTVEEVAERYRCSPKAIHDRTRKNTIPYLKRAGMRRLLFPVAELEAWDAGARLERVEMPDGYAVRTQNVRNGPSRVAGGVRKRG